MAHKAVGLGTYMDTIYCIHDTASHTLVFDSLIHLRSWADHGNPTDSSWSEDCCS